MPILLFCVIGMTGCNNDKEPLIDDVDDDVDDSQEQVDTLPSSIIPSLDWGASLTEIRDNQDKSLSLSVANDTLLRYVNDGITIDYKFKDGCLICSSLTQSNISNLVDIADAWLKGYDKLVESETALVCMSEDKGTLAYGRLYQGNDCGYVSVAWTMVDPDEEDEIQDGPDFSPSGNENGYDYVDLGIGIGWAVQNVRASSPEKEGAYYMWGETIARSSCWWWYYSLYNGSSDDYLDEDKFYSPYSNISGTSYDAAKANMGGKWRMPTRAEFNSLINNCELKVGKYNNVDGCIITGPSGKSVFFPATGQKKKDEIRLTNTVFLWSSTTYGKSCAYYLELLTKNIGRSGVAFMDKFYGMPIRGVVDLK